MNNTNPFPLPDDTLPPLPKAGEYGPQVCSTVRLYLAILDDLSSEQVQLLFEHVDNCAECAGVHRLMRQTTRMLADLPASAPSPRVDQAVMTALAAKSGRKIPAGAPGNQDDREGIPTPSYITRARERRRGMVGAPLAGTLSGGQVTLGWSWGAALVGGALKSRAVKTVVSVTLAAILL